MTTANIIELLAVVLSCTAMVVRISTWLKGIADDVHSIKVELTAVVRDHEHRIRTLEKRGR